MTRKALALTLETIQRLGAFDGCALPRGEQIAVDACPFATRLMLRGAPDVAAAIAPAFGVGAPLAPLQSAIAGERAALWMGPDEWLLLAPMEEGDLAARLASALSALPHALVDISHRQAGIEISGAGAATLLNAGVNLDLSGAAFAPGVVVRTLFLKAEITLWRRGADRWRLETGRSFAPYLAAALMRSAQDWGLC